jgi:hypothetical protein
MTLGADNTICKKEYVDAMRPIAGDNVDLPQIQDNLGALGTAVFRVATVHATTVSNAASDAAFWAWVGAIAAWQTGVVAAVTAWAPTAPAEQALRTALLAIPAPPPAPTSQSGRIT